MEVVALQMSVGWWTIPSFSTGKHVLSPPCCDGFGETPEKTKWDWQCLESGQNAEELAIRTAGLSSGTGPAIMKKKKLPLAFRCGNEMNRVICSLVPVPLGKEPGICPTSMRSTSSAPGMRR